MYPKIKTVLPDIINQINFNKKIEMVITPMTGAHQGYIKQEDFYDKSDYWQKFILIIFDIHLSSCQD